MSAASAIYPSDDTVETKFREFRSTSVDLPDSNYKFGRDLAGMVIDVAGATPVAYLPGVLTSKSFLGGSLNRRTQAQPLDDIDVFLAVNAGGLVMTHSGQREPFTLSGSLPNALATEPRFKDGSYVSSALLVNELERKAALVADELNRRLGESLVTDFGIASKRKSLYLEMSAVGLKVDLVFVLEGIAEYTGDLDHYYLPIGARQSEWKSTNPKEDRRRLSSQNQLLNGNLLPLIRILKWWNANRNGNRLKGIHLEVVAEQVFAATDPDRIFSGLRYFFERAPALVEVPCPDPTGLGSDLDSTLSEADRSASLEQLKHDGLALAVASARLTIRQLDSALTAIRVVFPI